MYALMGLRRVIFLIFLDQKGLLQSFRGKQCASKHICSFLFVFCYKNIQKKHCRESAIKLMVFLIHSFFFFGLIRVIAFEHRKSVVSKINVPEYCSQKLMFHVDTERSSSTMAYEYFSAQLLEMRSNDVSFRVFVFLFNFSFKI